LNQICEQPKPLNKTLEDIINGVESIPLVINPQTIGLVNSLIGQISPQLCAIVTLLKKENADCFDITLSTGDVLKWNK
jgi:hypothetical protein